MPKKTTAKEIPEFSLTDIQDAEALAEEDRREARQAYDAILSAVSWLEAAAGATREARERLGEKIGEAQEFLSSHLNHGNRAVRRSVWKALFTFELSRPIETMEEAEQCLGELLRKSFLKQEADGSIEVFGLTYNVSPKASFDNAEIEEMQKLFLEFVSRTKKAVRSKATLSWKELLSGKEGGCRLFIPPEKRRGESGQFLWRSGGVLVVESKNGRVSPIDASGKIETAVRQAIELKVSLPLRLLNKNEPSISDDPNDERRKKTQLFWHLLHRGLQFCRWMEDASSCANISPAEFFLGGKPGLCLADAEEPWQTQTSEGKELWIARPVFVVARVKSVNSHCVIRLEKIPPYLEDYLGPCLGQVYEEKGEKFNGVAQPLRSILQAIYGKTLVGAKGQ